MTYRSADDMECIYNYEMQFKQPKKENFASIVTPTREDRYNKRRYESAQSEKAKKTVYTQSNIIVNLCHLNDTFPTISSAWEKLYTEKFIKLRRYLTTVNKINSALQEIIIYEDTNTKLYSMCLSAPKVILVETLPNSDIQITKEVKYENRYYKNIIYKHEILYYIIEIEKNYSYIVAQEKEEVNHTDVSISLRNLACQEQANSNIKMSAYYNFLSEQIIMINTKCNERVYPADSFTLSCAIQLHSNSTNRYETIRENVPFILLPDKRTLFNLSKNQQYLQIAFLMKIKLHPIVMY